MLRDFSPEIALGVESAWPTAELRLAFPATQDVAEAEMRPSLESEPCLPPSET